MYKIKYKVSKESMTDIQTYIHTYKAPHRGALLLKIFLVLFGK